MKKSCPEVELSEQGLEYFQIFWKLSALREIPTPILPGVISDWCEATDTELLPWEKTMLMSADTAYRGKINEMSELHRKADKGRSQGYQTNGHRNDRL